MSGAEELRRQADAARALVTDAGRQDLLSADRAGARLEVRALALRDAIDALLKILHSIPGHADDYREWTPDDLRDAFDAADWPDEL